MMRKALNQVRVRACVAVIDEGKILLVPHHYPDRPTRWYLPGGKVEWLEPLESAARREFLEETGIELGRLSLLDVCESFNPDAAEPYHSVTITYCAHSVGGELRAEETHSAVYGDKTPRWFGLSELPEIATYLQPSVARAFNLESL